MLSKRAIRLCVIVLLPFFVLWAIVEALARGMWGAVRMAWLHAREEIDEGVRAWRTGRLP